MPVLKIKTANGWEICGSPASGGNADIEVDSELSETSENPVQNKIVNAAISSLIALVGDTSVAEQITNAVAQKSQVQIITWEADD